jgi:hypothetical protein
LLLLNAIDRVALALLLERYQLHLKLVSPQETITGSYWGECEAGLVGNQLVARLDTPLHSVLHEASHYICMTPERRVGLLRDAGGDDVEESAVCFLQVLLAEELNPGGGVRLCSDMDAWGYSFRLGNTAEWFEKDSEDARAWLLQHGIITARCRLTGYLRC